MRVTTGTVVNGRIEVPGEEFAEGVVVTILAPEDRETFTLGPEAEADLLEAVAEADRGELVSEKELWRGVGRGLARGFPLPFPRRALREIRKVSEWWDLNRPAAPGAFHEALEKALQLISTQPNIG